MEICPLSIECILSERGSFYSRLSPRGICGNLTFKIAIQKFIHYIQKFIRFVVALILMFHIALFLLFVIAKIATISIFPKIILLSLIKIAGCSLKIAIRHPKILVRYLKIAGLKISVHSLKIAGLKIIARVCVYVRMWVRGCVGGCAPHFADVSKIAQDATGAGTQAPEPEPQRTQEHKRPPQAPERPPQAPSARV